MRREELADISTLQLRKGAGGRGGAGQAMADRNKQNCTSHKPCGLNKNPDSQPCVTKTFPASFVPQPGENHTSQCLCVVCVLS